jgi:hypothetical protein
MATDTTDTTRRLDEQVATILGWTDDVVYGWFPPGEVLLAKKVWDMTGHKTECPSFSTNWGLVEEMLAWLMRWTVFRVDFYRDTTIRLRHYPWGHDAEVRADSCPELIALSVVNVARLQGGWRERR